MSDERLDDVDAAPEEDELWLMSYADLFTLLVAVFVLLVAGAQIDKSRYDALAKSLGSAVDATPVPENVVLVLDQTEVLKALRTAVDAAGLGNLVSVQMTGEGVELTANSELMFESGQAVIGEQGAALLRTVASILQPLPCVVAVGGHTDDLPIASKVFPSNWELSATRASGVVRMLQEQGIEARRLTAVGYADTRPAAALDAAEGLEAARARNRRVVLLITRDASR
jgi:chemotaxis protein MotB